MKNLQLLGYSKRAGRLAHKFSSQSNTGQRKPILRELPSRRLNLAESSSFGSPLMYTIKMGVLILIGTNGKVKIARYKNSPRVIEPIYSLLGFIFIVLLTRERERVSGVRQFAFYLPPHYLVCKVVLHAPLGH